MVVPRAIGIAMVVAMGAPGCISFDEVQCADGHLCPPGSRCDDVNGGCILLEQLQACTGIGEGEDCSLDGAGGTCTNGACIAWFCGDGKITGAETCEGLEFKDGIDCTYFGFTNATGLVCTDACNIDKTACTGGCGDNHIDEKELCDGTSLPAGVTCKTLGFYDEPGLECSGFCTYNISKCTGKCGDRLVNGPEQCDAVAPVGESCLDYSFDAGRLGCTLCAPGFEGCTVFGWSKVQTATALRLTGIWGASSTNFYVTGQTGTLLHYDGDTVSPVSNPATVDLNGIWGSGADVFVVGANDTLLHSTGGAFTQMTVPATGTLYAIWGSAANDVYAVGDGGTVLHYDGTWSTVTTGAGANDLRAIWGSDANNIFAVGANGMVAHYTGSWSASSVGAFEFTAVWGSGSNNVFAAGIDGSGNAAVFRWGGGTTWTAVYSVNPGLMKAVWGSAANDAFAVGTELLHHDGTKWTPLVRPADLPSQARLGALWGSPTGDVWTAGENGYLAHWGGASWTSSTTGTTSNLRSVSALGPSDAIAVGFSTALGVDTSVSRRYDGVTWSPLSVPASQDGLNSVWYGSPSFAVAVGQASTAGVIYHLNGSAWTNISSGDPKNCSASPALPSPQLRGVWGSSVSDVYAVGGSATGVVRHFDGSCWSTPSAQPSATSFLQSVSGIGSTVFANTSSPPAVFSLTSTWAALPAPSPAPASFGATWANSPTDLFAVGDAILHFNGTAWERMTGNGQVLVAVSGTGPRNVFAVGSNSRLLHYDGVSWTPIKVPAAVGTFLRGVAATSRSLLVVGDGGFAQRLSFSIRKNEVNCRDGWDDDSDGNPDCADADCASDLFCAGGGTCSVVEDLKCGDNITGSTVGRTPGRDYYKCDPKPENGAEAIYRIVPTADGTATATLSDYGATELDLVVVGAMPSSAACDPDFACIGVSAQDGSATETKALTLVKDRAQYIIVEGRNASSSAPFTLKVTCP